MRTFMLMAAAVANQAKDLAAVRNPSPAVYPVLARLILFTATVLAIYKPREQTPSGRRKAREARIAA